MAVKDEPDFLVAASSSMVALTPVSADANKAVDAGLIDYEEWQVIGGSILLDPRIADDLIGRLKADGFVVAEE
jgi:hypothetical protein